MFEGLEGLNVAPDSFSISAWIKPNSLDYDVPYTALVEYDRWDAGGPAKSWFGLWIKRGGNLHFRVGHDRNWASTINSDSKMRKGEWNFVTATYDANTSVSSVYINGVKDSSKTISIRGFYSNPTESFLTIGSSKYRSGFTKEFFNGVIDEVAIYKGVLSSEQIESLYFGEEVSLNLNSQLGTQSRECLSSIGTKKTENRDCYVGCSPNVVCTDWTDCLNGSQERYCEDVACGTDAFTEERSCVEGCVENWSCEWSECLAGFRFSECVDLNSCGTDDYKPGRVPCEMTQEVFSESGGASSGRCTPDVSCEDWGECRLEFGVEDLFESVENKEGVRARGCVDNGCGGEYVESEACSLYFPVVSKLEDYCGEKYVLVYSANGSLVSRIEYKKLDDTPSLDIELFSEGYVVDEVVYCDYCFNAVFDEGLEEGVDCGGECPECSLVGRDNFDWFDRIMGALDLRQYIFRVI